MFDAQARPRITEATLTISSSYLDRRTLIQINSSKTGVWAAIATRPVFSDSDEFVRLRSVMVV